MFKKLKETIFGKPRRLKVSKFSHPDLGVLKLNEEIDCWEVTVQVHGDEFEFGIGGDETPDETLIQHAIDILQDYPAFKQTVLKFLGDELKKFKGYEEEIRSLTLEQVCLCWPDRPEGGMIYFDGPDEFRVWRCDYVNRKPKDLGFDD
jgi:hypothetical protein